MKIGWVLESFCCTCCHRRFYCCCFWEVARGRLAVQAIWRGWFSGRSLCEACSLNACTGLPTLSCSPPDPKLFRHPCRPPSRRRHLAPTSVTLTTATSSCLASRESSAG